MRNLTLLSTLIFFSISLFGQENKFNSEAYMNAGPNAKFYGKESKATGKAFNNVPGIMINKSKFDLSKTTDDKSFRKAVYNQCQEYIAENLNDNLYKAAVNYNTIKFEQPYINFSVWINSKGKPELNFFSSNIDADKNASKSLRMIVSQLHFDENFHLGLKKYTNRQFTLFIPLAKETVNQKTKYVVSERTESEQSTFKEKRRNTSPAYYPSCENKNDTLAVEKKNKAIKDCMEYQLIQHLRNNFDKNIAYKVFEKIRKIDDIKKLKIKAWVSFKFNEIGKPCEYQAISISPKINKEILRIAETFPQAIPAELKGKKTKYKYRIPLKFY